jgi:O-antigen ligase
MTLTTRLQFYWRHLGWTERGFILLPLLILTPRLLDHPSAGHNGEPSQEFIITLALLALLGVLACETRHNTHLRFNWRGRGAGLLWVTALFTLWSVLSLMWTTDIGATLDHTVLWFSYTVLLFIGRIVLRRRSLIVLIAMLLIAGMGVSLIRLLQYWSTSGARPLASALYLNLGVEPEILVTILPLVLVVQMTVRRKSIALLCLFIAAFMCMGSLSTYQRTPILALLVASFFLIAGLKFRWVQRRSSLRLALLVLVLVVTSAVQLSLPSKLQADHSAESGKDFVVKQVKGIREMESNTSSRLQFWGAGLEMARAHPLQGIGAGAFKTDYLQYRRLANKHPFWGQNQLYSQVEGIESTYRMHNEFIQVLSELGVIGLILVGLLLSLFATLLWQCQSSQRWLALCLGTGMAAFLVCSCFSSFSFRWIPCGFTAFLLMTMAGPLARNTTPRPTEKGMRRLPLIIVATLFLFAFLTFARTSQVMLSEYYELQGRAEILTNQTGSFQYYQKALVINPYNFSASAGVGELLYRTKRPHEAIAPLARGLHYGVNNINQQALLSFAYAQSGDLVRAREVLQESAQAYPDSLFIRALYIEALEREGNSAAANEQRAILQAGNAEEAEAWEYMIRHGIRATILAAHNQHLVHPATLKPKNGVSALEERERLYSTR